jgi:hypothetical protein
MNSEKLTRERRKLMLSMLERKIRLRARQFYEDGGQQEGRALEDWVRAESEVLKSSILVPLWALRDQSQSTEPEAGIHPDLNPEVQTEAWNTEA